jgi:hypothetical protein
MKLHDARVGIIATASSQTFVWAIAISVNILAANKFPWSAIVVDGSRAPGSARMLGGGSPCLWWFVIVSKPHPGRRRPREYRHPARRMVTTAALGKAAAGRSETTHRQSLLASRVSRGKPVEGTP